MTSINVIQLPTSALNETVASFVAAFALLLIIHDQTQSAGKGTALKGSDNFHRSGLLSLLAVVIGFEYLGVGMGTAAFTAFIAREASKTYAATQFALFTALAAVPRTLANASTGLIVEQIGWVDFFHFCTVLALPGMLLLFWVVP